MVAAAHGHPGSRPRVQTLRLASLALSFTEYDVINAPEFVGWENYRELFDDPRLGQSLVNTFYYAALHVPLACAVANANLDIFEREGLNQHVREQAPVVAEQAASGASTGLWFALLGMGLSLAAAVFGARGDTIIRLIMVISSIAAR